jgi:hypothetical protein
MKPTKLDESDPIQKDLARLLIIVEGLNLRKNFPEDHSVVRDLRYEAQQMIQKYEAK